ncbi:isopentenyl phosphate kinase family protein [Chromobacterium violaceum]|uniref:isopentenyl phosphate kinase family protein n=1 Tax=Chromobacterium violaceum TaxID=536 RepID=UPI00143DB5D2|nr:isopentenyl phosphate kinase family protein [Chromobacterium violaceum]QIY79979.1 isopentenyl phosphate kinase family protein [Chromobacterium violaceum]
MSGIPHSASAPGCAVVKLGGSLITCEGPGGPDVDRDLLTARARELAACGRPLVLVHGTGTYGKPPARRYGYLDGRLPSGRAGVVAEVARDLARLELEVVDCLEAGGLKPLRLPAIQLFRASAGRASPLDLEPVRELLARGVTPVVGGNFVLDCDGFAVCSSDIMAVELALALGAASLVLATRAHGVYREHGRGEAIHGQLSDSDGDALRKIDAAGQDVSGGMLAKISHGFRAARHGIATYVVDGRVAGNLNGALDGSPLQGTRLLSGQAGG